MRVLLLGPRVSPLYDFLSDSEGEVLQTADRLDRDFLEAAVPDFLVSHGYRHILRHDVLDLFPNKAVNLHISLLPWNRGADPNLWSFVEDTPKGVTVHYLDEGIDTGDIIVQQELSIAPTETLRTSYEKLQTAIVSLFITNWSRIRSGACPRKPQEGAGSCHRARDKERLAPLLARGWDTPVSALRAASPKRDRIELI